MAQKLTVGQKIYHIPKNIVTLANDVARLYHRDLCGELAVMQRSRMLALGASRNMNVREIESCTTDYNQHVQRYNHKLQQESAPAQQLNKLINQLENDAKRILGRRVSKEDPELTDLVNALLDLGETNVDIPFDRKRGRIEQYKETIRKALHSQEIVR